MVFDIICNLVLRVSNLHTFFGMPTNRGRRVVDILSGSGPDDLGSNPSDSVPLITTRLHRFPRESFLFSRVFFFVKSDV